MVNYWICVTNEENWNVVKKRKVWGVPERSRRQIENVKPDDLLVMYVKPQRVAGIFKAVSGSFEDLIPKLRFITNKKMWTGHLRRAMRTIPREDYETTKSSLKRT